MPTSRYWITDEPWPASDQVAADAQTAGADMILHGVPASLIGIIPTGTTGYYEVVRPDPAQFPPLDATGALATLLVVEGVLDIGDAAHSVGTTGEHLVHEATAWGVG